MESLVLPLDQIKTDGGTQARVTLSEHIIKEYADALERGDEFPPLEVYFDTTTYWLADGFHRIRAAAAAGRDTIAVTVHPGGKREALLHAIGANETHGHRRSDADRRQAVRLMLTDQEWQHWSNNEIARQCSVSEFLVRIIRHELEPAKEKTDTPKPTRTATRKGSTYTIDTSRIGSATPRKRTASNRAEPSVFDGVPPQTETETSEPAADLSSMQSKIASALTERIPDDLAPPSPALIIPEPPRPLTLIQLWQESTDEERQEFIVVCHEELRQLLTAYETPPPDHTATVAQQILAWHHEGMSQRAIANRLNEEHISTISGRGTWNSGQVAKLLAKERQA
jgi:hypothetical protein